MKYPNGRGSKLIKVIKFMEFPNRFGLPTKRYTVAHDGRFYEILIYYESKRIFPENKPKDRIQLFYRLIVRTRIGSRLYSGFAHPKIHLDYALDLAKVFNGKAK